MQVYNHDNIQNVLYEIMRRETVFTKILICARNRILGLKSDNINRTITKHDYLQCLVQTHVSIFSVNLIIRSVDDV